MLGKNECVTVTVAGAALSVIVINIIPSLLRENREQHAGTSIIPISLIRPGMIADGNSTVSIEAGSVQQLACMHLDESF